MAEHVTIGVPGMPPHDDVVDHRPVGEVHPDVRAQRGTRLAIGDQQTCRIGRHGMQPARQTLQEFGEQQAPLRHLVLQLGVLWRIGNVDARSDDADCRRHGPTMRRTVDPARQSGNDHEPRLRESGGEIARHRQRLGSVDLRHLIDDRSPLHFEIGFGGGEHMAYRADLLPDHGFIGCEPFINGVASLLGAIEERGLERRRARLKRGQALIWAANLLHGGDPITDPNSTRRSGCARYCPLTSRA